MTPAELKSLRGSRTQREFAALIRFPQPRIAEYESGRKPITDRTAALIRERLREAAAA